MKPISVAIAVLTLSVITGEDARAQAQGRTGDASVVTVAGVLEPQQLVDVAPTVEGQIQSFGPAGDFAGVVKKGDVLAQIDPARWKAEAAIAKAHLQEAAAGFVKAKAEVALAEREYERTTQTRRKDDIAVSQAALEVAKTSVLMEEAKVASRKAELARAEANVDACIVRSPIDGVVLDRRANVGQFVTPVGSAATLFLIGSDLKHLELWASVPEQDIARIAKGQAATFTASAYRNQTFKATVKQIRLNASPLNNHVSYTVALDVDNQSGSLLPYMSARVNIEVGERR
jgi:HlyD family secretion protein